MAPAVVRDSLDTYTDLVYGSPQGIRNNNCYAWAIGHFRDSGNNKLQPGDLSPSRQGVAESRQGVAESPMSLESCGSLHRRARADLGPDARTLGPKGACPEGWHAARAFLDPGRDYHWYRHHKDVLVRTNRRPTSLANRLGLSRSAVTGSGSLLLARGANLYSHKRGLATGPLLEDSCGRLIKDPERACRDYGDLKYTKSCGGMCVRNRVL
jgi:hypothetical protein